MISCLLLLRCSRSCRVVFAYCSTIVKIKIYLKVTNMMHSFVDNRAREQHTNWTSACLYYVCVQNDTVAQLTAVRSQRLKHNVGASGEERTKSTVCFRKQRCSWFYCIFHDKFVTWFRDDTLAGIVNIDYIFTQACSHRETSGG